MNKYSVTQLKRDAKEGIISAVMTVRDGLSVNQADLPERLRGARKIIGANSNSLTVENPLDADKPSWLPLPKASLIEYTDQYLRIYAPGYREPNVAEQRVLDEWKTIENSEQYQKQVEADCLTDGSSTYYQKMAFFRKHNMEYLFGTKQKGLVVDFNRRNAGELRLYGMRVFEAS